MTDLEYIVLSFFLMAKEVLSFCIVLFLIYQRLFLLHLWVSGANGIPLQLNWWNRLLCYCAAILLCCSCVHEASWLSFLNGKTLMSGCEIKEDKSLCFFLCKKKMHTCMYTCSVNTAALKEKVYFILFHNAFIYIVMVRCSPLYVFKSQYKI